MLQEDGKLLEEKVIEAREKTDQLIQELVSMLFKKYKVGTKDIEMVGVCLGPGSYTGLRVGLAFAKGFCQFNGCKVIGVDAFETLSEGNNKSIPLIDAKNRRAYYKLGNKIKVDDLKIAGKELKLKKGSNLFGSGAVQNEAFLRQEFKVEDISNDSEVHRLSAISVGKVALEKVDKYKVDLFKIEPIYVQEANITKSKK